MECERYDGVGRARRSVKGTTRRAQLQRGHHHRLIASPNCPLMTQGLSCIENSTITCVAPAAMGNGSSVTIGVSTNGLDAVITI